MISISLLVWQDFFSLFWCSSKILLVCTEASPGRFAQMFSSTVYRITEHYSSDSTSCPFGEDSHYLLVNLTVIYVQLLLSFRFYIYKVCTSSSGTALHGLLLLSLHACCRNWNCSWFLIGRSLATGISLRADLDWCIYVLFLNCFLQSLSFYPLEFFMPGKAVLQGQWVRDVGENLWELVSTLMKQD